MWCRLDVPQTIWMFTIDMRTIATFVMRNEEHRYLNACLKWTSQFVDDIFVFDDQSTDDSVAIARQYGPVAVRHGSTASFLQNESEFREAAWMTMQNTLEPERGDIILALDTDEFVIMNGFNLTLEIGEVLQVPIHEVFGVKENVPMIRTDGYWGGISGQRVLSMTTMRRSLPIVAWAAVVFQSLRSFLRRSRWRGSVFSTTATAAQKTGDRSTSDTRGFLVIVQLTSRASSRRRSWRSGEGFGPDYECQCDHRNVWQPRSVGAAS